MSDMEIKTDVSTQPAIVSDKETSSSEKHIFEPEFSDTVSCDKSGWCGCNVSAVEVDVVDSSSSTGCRVPDPCVVSGNMLDLVKDSSLTECTVINHIISSGELGKRVAVGASTVNVCGRSTGAGSSSSVEPKTLHSVAIVTEEIAIHRDTVQIQNVDGNKSSRTPSPTVVSSMTRSQNGRCIEQEEARAVSPSVAPPAVHNDECGLDSAGKKSPSDMAGSVSNGGPQTDSRPPCENSTEGSRSVELESGTSGSGFTSECLSRESPLQGPSLHHDPRPAADTGSNREAENEWEDKASDLGLSCHSTAGLRSLPCSVSYNSTPVSPGQAEVCGDEAFLEDGQRFMEVSLSSRNTYEASRRQSAPGHLPPGGGLDAADPSDLELQSKMPGIAEYLGRSLFSRRLQDRDLKGVNPSSPGWKLFGKVPPKQSPTKDSRTIQQEYVAKLGRTTAENSPTQNAQGRSRKNLEFEPLSTTALILEDRPANLPAKSVEEAQRHRQEYQEMVAEARKRELKEAQKRQKQMKERFKQEESIANAMVIWNNDILPHWDSMKSSRRARELWWHGLPPNVRGKVWSLAIGNELNITPGLYGIFLSRAKEKWRLFSETGSENEAEDGSSADRESSLELIKLDISRTFPSLFIFQKGGPYHDLLHSVLGAYTCYRPDVGYVQGMSFIAAVLILNLEEADAFIAFANLLNKPCQLAFFRVDHELMLKYFAAFEVFFEENLPRLFIHFQSSSLTPDLYLIDWIFTLYSKSLPLDVACRVWDVFCRDGEEFLFRTGLGILRLYEDVLLQMDFIHVCQFLTRPPNDELLSDRLFACIAATPMLAGGNRKWSQVFSSLVKDNKEMEKTSS